MSEDLGRADHPRGRGQRLGLVIGLAIFALVLVLPPPAGLVGIAADRLQLAPDHADVSEVASGARATLAIMLLMVAWWVTEAVPLPVTALLPGVLLPLLHVTGAEHGATVPFTARAAFSSYAHPVIYLFLGGFLLAVGMQKSGLARRITLTVLNQPLVARGSGSMLLAMMVVTGALSMLISNTATVAMMLPIAAGMLEAIGEKPGASRMGAAMILGIGWSASIGGIGTLIGTPPNTLAKGALMAAGLPEISFLEWMKLGMPVALIGMLVAWCVLMLIFRPRRSIDVVGRESIARERRSLGPLTGDEMLVCAVVGLVMTLWLTHPHWDKLMPAAWFVRLSLLDENGIGLLGGLLLFVVPARRAGWRPVLTWSDSKYVDWGTLVLFGGGLALSAALFRSGVSDWIADGVVSRLHGWPPVLCLAAMVLLVDYLTEITSNTAVTAMIAPIAIAVAPGLGLSSQTLCIAAAMAASMAFMLPVATPPNALVYATGYFRIGQMIRAGCVMNVIGAGLVVAIIWLLTS